MAEKRMFTQKITDSDAFLDMPLSTQALYFHLNMMADDDGFINNPKRIQRTIGASEDDLKLLIAKRFVICFENGVIVIKHWLMHNTLRKDRYKPTQYQEQFAMLSVKANNAYTEKRPESMATYWQPSGNQMEPQCSVGKCRLVEGSIDNFNLGECEGAAVPCETAKAPQKNNGKPSNGIFVPPSIEEVKDYCISRNNGIDPEAFIAFYDSKGWMIGKNKMKSWKSAIITWEKAEKRQTTNHQPYHKQSKAEELDDFYKMAAEWSES